MFNENITFFKKFLDAGFWILDARAKKMFFLGMKKHKMGKNDQISNY